MYDVHYDPLSGSRDRRERHARTTCYYKTLLISNMFLKDSTNKQLVKKTLSISNVSLEASVKSNALKIKDMCIRRKLHQ